jgi:MFS family permease
VLAPPFIGTTIFFHQVYLSELRGWEPSVFAASFAIMSSMTILFALIAGQLVDRFSATRLLPSFLVPLSLSCFVLASTHAPWGAYAFMALMGISYGFSSTLFGALWPELYGSKHLGGIRSLIVAFMVFATAMGPGLTGALIDAGISYPGQIAAMGVYSVAVIMIMTLVSRRALARRRTALA